MNSTKIKILEFFKAKGCELSTSDLANYIYEEYSKVRDKSDINSKRETARLHRKLLHHINMLIREGILRVCRHGEKGQKFFALNLEDGEEITALTPKYKRRLVISKPSIPAMPIESYEQQGIVMKYETGTWIDKLNSLVVDCIKIENFDEFEKIIEKSLEVVNDCICLNGFESFITKFDNKRLAAFLEEINDACIDYGKIINCMINIAGIKSGHFKEFLERIVKKEIKNIILIYNINPETLQENFALFKEIISAYVKHKRIMNLKNERLLKAPIFIGRAGPYSFSDEDWSNKKDVLCYACSQSSLVVDVEKFHSLYGLDVSKFSQLMINISKSFLSANSIQRKKAEEYFHDILALNKPNDKEFLEFSRNYIRFWNYGLSQPGIDKELILNMISEAKKKVNEFSIAEETIYKSCGMPIRFKIALSCAFRKSEEGLSEAKYKHLGISSLEDLYSGKIKKELKERENVTEMFNGGNDVSFHRLGEFDAEDIAREISLIINTYRLPFFSYNFEGMRGNMKITSYL